MFNFSIDNIILGSDFVAIEYYSIKESERTSVSIIKKNKGTLEIVDTNDHIIDKEQKIFLTINTNQVLQKRIEGSFKNETSLLKKGFPSLQIDPSQTTR